MVILEAMGVKSKRSFLKDLEEKNGNDEGVEEVSKGRKNWVPTNVETLIYIHGEMDEDFMKNVKKTRCIEIVIVSISNF